MSKEEKGTVTWHTYDKKRTKEENKTSRQTNIKNNNDGESWMFK
jgi:hypothetical protein